MVVFLSSLDHLSAATTAMGLGSANRIRFPTFFESRHKHHVALHAPTSAAIFASFFRDMQMGNTSAS